MTADRKQPGELATEFDSAHDSPGLLLWQVTNRWQAAQRAALKPHDLTHVQFVLLASVIWLSADGVPVTQRALAEQAATDAMMTSQVLRALEAKGLLRRDDHPTDARAKSLVPTSAGKRLANRAVVDVEACDRTFFSRIGKQQATLVTLLQALAR